MSCRIINRLPVWSSGEKKRWAGSKVKSLDSHSEFRALSIRSHGLGATQGSKFAPFEGILKTGSSTLNDSINTPVPFIPRWVCNSNTVYYIIRCERDPRCYQIWPAATLSATGTTLWRCDNNSLNAMALRWFRKASNNAVDFCTVRLIRLSLFYLANCKPQLIS